MNKSFQFTKMHGLGNNYIYVNQFKEKLSEEELEQLAIRVSNPHTGIGADGMILICPSKVAPIKMRIFNRDGSEGKSCGNGLRCVAKYAYEHKMVTEEIFSIETLGGIVTARVYPSDGVVDFVEVDMGEPCFTRESIPMVGASTEEIARECVVFEGKEYECVSLSMGNPHTVFTVEKIEEAPLYTLGPIMEKHEWFPESVNTEFIEIVSPQEIHFRVWERGSGVTQACGTGACAAVVAGCVNGQLAQNEEVIVHLAGGDLQITWTKEGTVLMKGPAEIICDGIYYY